MRGFVPGLVHTTEQLGHRPCIGRSLAFHLRIEPVLIGSDLLFGQMLSQHGGYELDRFVVDFIGLSYGENNRSRRHRGEQLVDNIRGHVRSEEHTSELQSLMRISYAVFCLKNNKKT